MITADQYDAAAYSYKVWKTKHEEEYLDVMSYSQLGELLESRPTTGAERTRLYDELRKNPSDGTAETLYIRGDWTIDVEKIEKELGNERERGHGGAGAHCRLADQGLRQKEMSV